MSIDKKDEYIKINWNINEKKNEKIENLICEIRISKMEIIRNKKIKKVFKRQK